MRPSTAATLTGADFTNADVRGAGFDQATYNGFTASQLYSTASYQNHDLTGISFGGSDLSGWNFAGQNLTNSSFGTIRFSILTFPGAARSNFLYAMLAGADFTGADTRGADIDLSGATTTNLIRPDGHISGLDLSAGGLLAVHDYHGNPTQSLGPIPIKVDQHLAMGPGGTLRMVFEADAWGSTISFAPDIPVTLGGVLELTYAPDVNLAGEIGRTIDLFDWTGVNPTGAFAVESLYQWDLSQLYTTGEVTLAAVPEPSSIALAATGLVVFILLRRRRPHNR